jgi:dTDP-4-amino-4,6-dideoxygalactose transaminase
MKAALEAVTAYLRASLRGRRPPPFQLLGSGPIGELEEKLRTYTGMRYCVLTASGTAALLTLGLALGMRRGTHFIMSPYAWAGSAVWLYLGARCVFADVEPETLTLDPEAARRAITPRTRALLAVETDGVPADDEALRRTADEHGMALVVDGARSFGARRDGRPAGTKAHALVLSFTWSKALCLGEGGAILTDDADLYERILFYGQHPMRQKRELGLQAFNECVLNARIHPLAALWGRAVFDRTLIRIRRYRNRMFRLVEALNRSNLTVPLPYRPGGIEPSFYRLCPAWRGESREAELVEHLARLGWHVQVRPLEDRPLYRNPVFRRLFRNRIDYRPCPVLEKELGRRFVIFPH